jgi:hypothetical protein
MGSENAGLVLPGMVWTQELTVCSLVAGYVQLSYVPSETPVLDA